MDDDTRHGLCDPASAQVLVLVRRPPIASAAISALADNALTVRDPRRLP